MLVYRMIIKSKKFLSKKHLGALCLLFTSLLASPLSDIITSISFLFSENKSCSRQVSTTQISSPIPIISIMPNNSAVDAINAVGGLTAYCNKRRIFSISQKLLAAAGAVPATAPAAQSRLAAASGEGAASGATQATPTAGAGAGAIPPAAPTQGILRKTVGAMLESARIGLQAVSQAVSGHFSRDKVETAGAGAGAGAAEERVVKAAAAETVPATVAAAGALPATVAAAQSRLAAASGEGAASGATQATPTAGAGAGAIPPAAPTQGILRKTVGAMLESARIGLQAVSQAVSGHFSRDKVETAGAGAAEERVVKAAAETAETAETAGAAGAETAETAEAGMLISKGPENKPSDDKNKHEEDQVSQDLRVKAAVKQEQKGILWDFLNFLKEKSPIPFTKIIIESIIEPCLECIQFCLERALEWIENSQK